jgi:hypothetical protein
MKRKGENKMEHTLLELIQNKMISRIRLELLCKNIEPTKKAIECEVDKRMVKLADKLSDLAWSE